MLLDSALTCLLSGNLFVFFSLKHVVTEEFRLFFSQLY